MVRFWSDEGAQSLVEYAILIACLSVLAACLGWLIGESVRQLWGGHPAEGGAPKPPTPAPIPGSRP